MCYYKTKKGGVPLNKLFTIVITIVVAVALLPVITTGISSLTAEGGDLAGTPVAGLLDLVPLLYVATVIIGGFLVGTKFNK